MFVKMKFIVGVTLLVIQSSFLNALQLGHEIEEWQIDLDDPTVSTSLDAISGRNENSEIMTENLEETDDTDYPENHQRSKFLSRMGGVEKLAGGSKTVAKIIFDIESQNFHNALRKIHGHNDLQGIVNNVIHKVYNNNEGNLGLILELVDSDDNVTSSLAIYKALNFEMSNNNHNSLLPRLKLMKSFNSKIIVQTIESDDEQSAAKTLKTDMDYIAGNSTADELKYALRMNDSEKITAISEIVYNHHPILFDSAIRQVLKQAFADINKPYLLGFFAKHKYASQSVYTYSNLFGEMRKRNQLNQPFLVNLAMALKKALGQEITDRYARETGFNLKIALPDSVRNLVFGDNLCIVNAYYHNRNLKEHLFAAGEQRDAERRKVFSWIPGGSITNGYWVIERHDDDTFYIKNRYYIRRERRFRTEYLYGAYIWKHGDSEMREVFTWINRQPDDDQFNWMFVPNGNNVYIKNAHHKEYLYASSDQINGDDRREIFTKSTIEKGSLWTIESCKARY